MSVAEGKAVVQWHSSETELSRDGQFGYGTVTGPRIWRGYTDGTWMYVFPSRQARLSWQRPLTCN